MGRLFGTDGVRGVANDTLTCEMAMRLGRAAAQVLSDGRRRRPVIVIGMDTRISSDMFAMTMAGGLSAMGADIVMLGTLPTPAVAYLIIKHKADAGIMISASHNPAEFNGIKVFGGDGCKLPDALEEQIEELMDPAHVFSPVPAAQIGRITQDANAAEEYIQHLQSVTPCSLDGLRVAVDCAHGSASVTARALFSAMGAEAVILNAEPDGLNINRACGSTHMEALSAYVAEHGLDAGVALDGDADRCLMTDERGVVVDGDELMAMLALDMKARGKLRKNTVVGTIMTNLGLFKFCEQNGMHLVATKVGDRFVLEEMLLGGYSFGGEQSGHLIFRDFASTGDGQMTALQTLALMKTQGARLSEMRRVMTRCPQASRNVRVSAEGKLLFYTNDTLRDEVEKAKQYFGDDGRVVVRVSGTEPLIRVMVECVDMAEATAYADRLARQVADSLGGEIA